MERQRDLSGSGLTKLVVILAVSGLLLTGVFFLALFARSLMAQSGPVAQARSKVLEQIMSQNAGLLEMYKRKYGIYPQNLRQVAQEGIQIYPVDPYLRPFYYRSSADGQSFELGSAGLDRKYGTDDDVRFSR